MSRVNARLLVGIGGPIVVILLLLAAWAIDSSRYTGKVPRNVKLASEEIGGMSEDRLARTVADLAADYAAQTVRIRASGETFEITAGQLGLRLDEERTVSEALDMNKDVNVLALPLTWLSSFVSPRSAELQFTVDRQELEAGIASLAGNASPTEPEIVSGTEGLAVVSGSAGRTVSHLGVAEHLLAQARAGETPIVIDTTIQEKAPAVSDDQAKEFVERINTATADGLTVTAGDHEVSFETPTVRSWLGATVGDGDITLTIDEETVQAAVENAVPTNETPKNATFTVVDNKPVVSPSQNGEVCCGDDTPQRIREAIDSGQNSADVDIEVVKPRISSEDIDELGIVEPVGSVTEWAGVTQNKSFTTYHSPGESRVTNIHLIADAVRGTVILPGEQFSMNEVVGQRTSAKGYVAAGAIRNGETVDEVGGGVSQFATTMFNAAYYAGLKINTYQAHSEHFSRYPRGREATMGWPAPDLVWTNNSPHAILVWTSYTNTSVTVTLYSTQWATAEQTGSSESRSGNCTVVTTTRTIHYPDGTTGSDQFSARYRDKGVTSC